MKMRALFQALGPEMSVCSRITAWLSASPRSTQHWTEGGSKNSTTLSKQIYPWVCRVQCIDVGRGVLVVGGIASDHWIMKDAV